MAAVCVEQHLLPGHRAHPCIGCSPNVKRGSHCAISQPCWHTHLTDRKVCRDSQKRHTVCLLGECDVSTTETTVGRCFWGLPSGLSVTPFIHAPPVLAPGHLGLGNTLVEVFWECVSVFCLFVLFYQKHSLFSTRTSELVQQESGAWD